MRHRPQYADLIETLAFAHEKMAFVTGPRQVGKTTLAQQLIERRHGGRYFNWDDVVFRRQWIKDPKQFVPEIVGEKTLVVFDELHKAPRWKSYLKGLYDLRKTFAHILVTGSAKLDVFRKGGESLLGRYFLFRLHPFTMGELAGTSATPELLVPSLAQPLASAKMTMEQLLTHGGFPEPYLNHDDQFTSAWRRLRVERLVRDDLRDLTRTHEIPLIEAAVALIPERVGSLFSVQSLAEDLEVAHPTARRWIEWLSQLYYCYRLFPHAKNIARSIKKQPKVYLWDWSEVPDPAARFENLVAGHLHKAVHFWTDSGLGSFELSYVRDKEKREVDFLIVRNKKPWLMAECKTNETRPSENLIRFARLLKPEIVVQIVQAHGVHESFSVDDKNKGYVVSADAFLNLL